MEIFISAVLGELASRSINFVISRSSKPKVPDVESSLQRALLRAQVVIDEATGCQITNQAMLQQLEMLKDAMYKGCYILDTSRYQSQDEEDAKDHVVVSYSFSLSKVNSLRLCLDVDIGVLGIELVSMPNQTSIDIELQYQSHCLDADEIARWNQGASEYQFVFGC